MKAAVLDTVGGPLEVQDIEIDPPGANEARIKIVACGVCHSDYTFQHGVLKTPLPIVLGHEAGGVVEAVGPGVSELKPGDHVIAVLTPSCGKCDMCKEGKPFLCMQMNTLMGNCTMLDGTTRMRRGSTAVHHLCGIAGFAEHAIVPVGSLIKVDPEVSLETICLIGCGVTTGVGAVLNTAQVKPETTVAVIGCGGVGLSVVQGARIAGAKTIIALDPVKEKRELAMSLGATHAVDSKEADTVRTVKKIVGGGVHYAFEVVGRADTISLAYDLLRPTGLAVAVGVAPPGDKAQIRCGGLMQNKGLVGSVYGSAQPTRDIPKFVDLYKRGELKLDPMISHRISVSDINGAFEEMLHGTGARSVVVF